MLSRKEIAITLAKLSQLQVFKDAWGSSTKSQRNTLKDQLIYRMMFNKKRSDDTQTDEYMELLKNEQSNKTDK